MEYNINNINISGSDVNEYIIKLINEVFAILPIYEECEIADDFKRFHVYLERLIMETAGGYFNLGTKGYLTLTNVLTGVNISTQLNHANVKSLTFYCISILNALKVVE